MKKYYVFALCLMALGACSDDDEETIVDSSVPLYQNLRVEYDATQEKTYVSANFKKESITGDNVQLSGTSSIRFNGQTPEYTASGPYLYNFTFPGTEDISFALTRKVGEVYTNKVSLDDVSFLAIVKSFTSISLEYGVTFVWVGEAVGEGETVQVRVVTSSGEYDFHTSNVGDIAVEVKLPATVAPGNATFYVSRMKTLPLQEDDKSAGGELNVIYTCEKEITLQ